MLVSGDSFFVLAQTLVGAPEHLVKNRLCVAELRDRFIVSGSSLFILAFLLKRETLPRVSFRLKTVSFADDALECSDCRLTIALLAPDAPFHRAGLCVNRPARTRRRDLCERAVSVVQVKQHAREADVRRSKTWAQA